MISTEGKTVQQVCDELAVKLIKQGKRCINDDSGGCVYGDGKGNHCSVGWLLPDDNQTLMDYWGDVSELCLDNEDLGPNDKFIRNNLELLYEIQRIHDSKVVDYRVKCLESLNEEFGINTDAWKGWLDLMGGLNG